MLSFLLSCSTSKVKDKHDDRLITAHWFKIPFQFALRDQDDNYLTHPFFDVDPRLKIKGKSDDRVVNYFVTTPENSSYKYDLDLYSGKLYKERDYCPIDDIWEFYKGDVEKPNFTQGIVPRTYDENKFPQKIIVFSDPSTVERFKYLPTNYDTARIVGSVILESCENYPCDSNSKWAPTQILVAVNSHDSSYSGINLISELRSKVDWSYVKAILVNQNGVHQVGKKYFPAYRISKELNLDDTLKYFESNTVPIKMEKLTAWREECFKLYDNLWSEEEKIRNEKYGQQDKFLKLFKDFYAKDSDRFYQCQKLVRPGNINDNPNRLWFVTYLQAFTNLEKNGFFYSCGGDSWSYNPRVDDDHLYNNQLKELARCRARDFEKSFDQAINGMSLMKNQTNRTFRFVEYDTQRGGSHQKIYAWIAESGKISVCKNAKEPVKSETKENQFDPFPQDVVWQNFSSDKDKTVK